MAQGARVEIVLVSSGHPALDQRVFDKEAVSLARHFPQVRVVAMHAADEVRSGVRITALAPYRTRWARFLLRPLQGFWAARGQGPRVLILQDAELLFWAPLVKLLTGWRIVYDAHEDFPQLLMSRSWIPAPLRRVIGHAVGVLEKTCARACDGIIAATGALVEHFDHPHRLPLYNLPSRDFLEEVAHHARPPAQRLYDVVHLGTLAEEGRLEYLIAVLDGLFTRKPAARGLVIGVQPDQEAQLRAHFPPERVTVLGKIPYQQVAAYLGDCRIGLNVFPTLLPHLRCAIPVKIFEYMAAGCNVVSSFLPEMQRLIGEDGAGHMMVLYTPDVGRFVDETVRLLDDPAALQRHHTALMALVRTHWSWECQSAQLARFITQIIDPQTTADEPDPAQASLAEGE